MPSRWKPMAAWQLGTQVEPRMRTGFGALPTGSRGLAVAVYMHTLHFTSREQLSWAFRFLRSSEFVQDCLTEPAQLRIRFVAAPAPAASLVEQIYLRGGLTWCVRSRFTGL